MSDCYFCGCSHRHHDGRWGCLDCERCDEYVPEPKETK